MEAVFNMELPNMRTCTQHKHLTYLPRADQDSGLMAKKCDGALARSPLGIKTEAWPGGRQFSGKLHNTQVEENQMKLK